VIEVRDHRSAALPRVTDPDAWPRRSAGDERRDLRAAELLRSVEDAAALSAAAKGGQRPVVVAQVDPIVLGILAPPGDCGVDVAVGEASRSATAWTTAAPRSASSRRARSTCAASRSHRRGNHRRGRAAGFVLTLQTREQHIRRERATVEHLHRAARNALAGVLYLGWLRRQGSSELGERCSARTAYERRTLSALEGVEDTASSGVREFALRLDADVAAVRRRCAQAGINPGVDVQALSGRAGTAGCCSWRSPSAPRADIDRLAGALPAAVAAEREAVGV